MRTFFLAALSTTALATAAFAQQQPTVTPSEAPAGTIQAKAALAECDRLISFLEQARPPEGSVTVEQASAWRQASDFDACRATLLRLTETKPDSYSTQSNQVPSPGNAAGPTGLPTVTSSGLPASAPGAPGSPEAAGAAAPRPAEPAQTGALPAQSVKVSALEDMNVYTGSGEKLGEVEKVLMGSDNKPYLLVSHGGFLGLGAKQVAISADQLALRQDRLVAETLTEDQVRALPEFKESANYKELDGDQTASLRAAR